MEKIDLINFIALKCITLLEILTKHLIRQCFKLNKKLALGYRDITLTLFLRI